MTTESFIKALGNEIRSRRKRKKLTQVGLAVRANVHPNTVSLIERAETVAGLEALLVLAEALDTPLSQIIKGAEDRINLR
ncbi:helix-turn-helix transcriptional regulator [Burkholderia sp. Ac-20345]|uniref:helix-turn-helix domain-containing protein n=1 Tax=Burkholderia sp. Ac-20345 TaxID=2703891 RepID=UPI00197B2B82|nr:helix-turn-helix transcriptional regulator [Burkholderia sp. Ac-20345]MBN3778712.1 helix-turn-helix transcriptional regulator [Burkholderia sp. Ac-20345]